MCFRESLVEGKMSACHITVPVRAVLGDVSVKVSLRPVIASEPVAECGIRIFVNDFVRGII